MIIDAVRLPTDVERGAEGGPLFSTIVNRTDGGNVVTNQNWQYPLFKGNISYGIQNTTDLGLVRAFFYARRGRARGFLFRDWSDYQVTDQVQIGTGDGVETDFQVSITYDDDVLPFTRPITRPVEATMDVYVNNVLANPLTWSLSTGGIIVFTSPPANGHAITWTGEFDIPVQFMTDQFKVVMQTFEAGEIPSLEIMEVRE